MWAPPLLRSPAARTEGPARRPPRRLRVRALRDHDAIDGHRVGRGGSSGRLVRAFQTRRPPPRGPGRRGAWTGARPVLIATAGRRSAPVAARPRADRPGPASQTTRGGATSASVGRSGAAASNKRTTTGPIGRGAYELPGAEEKDRPPTASGQRGFSPHGPPGEYVGPDQARKGARYRSKFFWFLTSNRARLDRHHFSMEVPMKDKQTAARTVVSREAWLEARRELLAARKGVYAATGRAQPSTT